jgi:hypothetical protein
MWSMHVVLARERSEQANHAIIDPRMAREAQMKQPTRIGIDPN